MTKAMTKKQVAQEQDQFADLFREIRGQFTKGRPLRVVLRHLRLNGKEGGDQDVSTWDADDFEGKDPNEFSQDVVADVIEDARIFPPVMQKYGLFFYMKNLNQHSHRIFVTTRGGGPEESGDVFSSEGPDEEGRRAQIMRHDEGFVRLNIMSLQKTMDSKDRQLDRAEAMISKLLDQFVPVLGAVQTMALRTAEQDFKLERQRKLYELLDEGGQKLMQFGPFVVAHKLKDKHPELAQMIINAASNPANDILKMLRSEMERNPDKGQDIFKAVMALPNGLAIVQALAQLDAQEKAAEKKQTTDNNHKAE